MAAGGYPPAVVLKTLSAKVLGTAAGVVDRAFVSALEIRNKRERARAVAVPHAEHVRLLGEIARAYGRPEHFEQREAFFPTPPAISPRRRLVRALEGRHHADGGVFDLTWPSRYTPWGSGVRDRYLARTRNQTAHARVYLAGPPRPAILLIHGYMGGHWALGELEWPISWFFRRGLDVVIPLLPFHALRGEGGAPPWPGSDPRITNEGFRQAIHDLRGLMAWMVARGAPLVGAMGMSLGGYTTALLATIEEGLGFAAPMIPLASIADFAKEQGRLGDREDAAEQHAALERANWVVSPLARPCLVPAGRVVVIAADRDRVTPRAHAERIGAHFGAPIVTIPGGHLLQIGRGGGFRAVAAMLEREGIIAPRARRRSPPA